MARRKICVVTGTRAEYGLLFWLMKEIQNDLNLNLQIIVTGMHFSPEFGLTYKVIEDDWCPYNQKHLRKVKPKKVEPEMERPIIYDHIFETGEDENLKVVFPTYINSHLEYIYTQLDKLNARVKELEMK